MLGLLLLLGLACKASFEEYETTRNEETTMEFGPCPLQVEQYFHSLYPEYQSPLLDVFSTSSFVDSDLESVLRKRTREKQQAGGATFGEAYVTPMGAWNAALMSNTGCTTCEDGCCNAAHIILDCGRSWVRLNYSNAESSKISLMTYRIRVRPHEDNGEEEKRSHLWALQGGPGGSGLSLLFLAVHSLQFATDVYIPDHRGTGLSSPISCKAGRDVIPLRQCVDFVEMRGNNGTYLPVNIQYFSVTNAARDLELLIRSQQQEQNATSTIIHAYSYGTRWATRLLQLTPANLTIHKVVLEGNVAKNTVFNDFAWLNQQRAGDRFMLKCTLDPACNAVFGKNTISDLITSITLQGEDNACTLALLPRDEITASAVREQVQNLLAQGLQLGMDGPYPLGEGGESVYLDYRTFFLAIIVRWAKCEEKANFRAFAAALAWIRSLSPLSPSDSDAPMLLETFNPLVYDIIVASEMRRYPIETRKNFDARCAKTDWGVCGRYDSVKLKSQTWRKYRFELDEYYNKSPKRISLHLLVINGEVDGNTFAAQAEQNFKEITTSHYYYNKSIAIVPDVGHHASAFGCGLQTVKNFIRNKQLPEECGLKQSMKQDRVLPLQTNFTIPPLLLSVMMGGSHSVFEGDVKQGYCQYNNNTEEATFNSLASCLRCYEYCRLISSHATCELKLYHCTQT